VNKPNLPYARCALNRTLAFPIFRWAHLSILPIPLNSNLSASPFCAPRSRRSTADPFVDEQGGHNAE
jgi:hypothetical protein